MVLAFAQRAIEAPQVQARWRIWRCGPAFAFADRSIRILSVAATDADWSVHRHILNGLQRRAKKVGSPREAGRVLSSGIPLDAGGREVVRMLSDDAVWRDQVQAWI
jgi:hypothetical protein